MSTTTQGSVLCHSSLAAAVSPTLGNTPTMRPHLLAICALRVSALAPRGAARDPARGRENVAVLSCGTQLGATTYGYLQRLKGLWASGLKEPVALLKDPFEKRALSSTLSSDFMGGLDPRRDVDTKTKQQFTNACAYYEEGGPPYGIQRGVCGDLVKGDIPGSLTALAEALDCVSCVCVGAEAADAAASLLKDTCAGSFIVELDAEPREHASSWSHLKGFRRLGGTPAVEDVAAVIAAAQSALGSTSHHRIRAAGPDGEAYTSPLDLQAWLLEACPAPAGVEALEAGPDPKFATW